VLKCTTKLKHGSVRSKALTSWVWWLVFGICFVSTVSAAKAWTAGHVQNRRLLGLYVFVGERLTADGTPALPENLDAYLRYCGYNTIEFADWSFEYPKRQREAYFQSIRARIAAAHAKDLKVFVILSTNMSREWAQVAGGEPAGKHLEALLFNPGKEPEEFHHRIEEVKVAIEKGFSKADGFEVFAGDWGGCLGEGCNYREYLRFGEGYRRVLKSLGLRAELVLNTWAISNWGVSLDPYGLKFWDGETSLSRKIIAEDVPFADGISLPGHNLYRPLALQLYSNAGRAVPNWPTRETIEAIHAQKKSAYLWPHFILSLGRGDKLSFRRVHFEVRYLKQLAEKARDLGVDGVFVNSYDPALEMGNIFAYGQLQRNPERSPQWILEDYTRLITAPNSPDQLADVLIFIENHSWWTKRLLQKYQMAPLPCTIQSYAAALMKLQKIVPLAHPTAPLLISPKLYLAEVRSALVFMQEHYDTTAPLRYIPDERR
jgi:hypothetical protein